jgi:hypothetical protein
VYVTANLTLTRNLRSSSTGALIGLDGNAVVSVVPTALTFSSLVAPYAPIVSPSFTGVLTLTSISSAPMTIVDNSSGASSLTINAAGNTNGAQTGANIVMVGSGTQTPSKTLRVAVGSFQIVNSANSNVIMGLTDAGNMYTSAGIDGTAIGATTPRFGQFASLYAGSLALGGGGASNQTIQNSTFITMNTTAGSVRGISSYSGGLERWQFGTNATTESGANVGSDFFIQSFADGGGSNYSVPLGMPFLLTRATGALTLTSTGSAPVTITDNGSGQAALTINAAANTNASQTGASILMVGSGAQTPNKTLRAAVGSFQIVNSANTNVIMGLTDAGNMYTSAGIDGTGIGATTPAFGQFLSLYAGSLALGGGGASNQPVGNSTFITMNGLTGTIRGISSYTSGLERWLFGTNATAETGANAGSDFFIQSYVDGTVANWHTILGTPFLLTRATGALTLTSTGLAPLTINDNGSGQGALTINAGSSQTGAGGQGAIICLNSGVLNKYIQAIGGNLQICNSANTVNLLTMDDFGNTVIQGNLTSLNNINAASTISAVNMDFTTIGAVSPSAGTFTNLTATGLISLPAATGNTGRNLIHNPLFRVQQRGVGPWTVAGYTADRWLVSTGTAGGTRSITIVTTGDTALTAFGDEAAQYNLVYTFAGGSAAGDFDMIRQRIEGLHRTSNCTVTVSFSSFCLSGTPKIGVSIWQNFGTGGSPSATLQPSGQSVTISTTAARYSLTFVVPSVVGKTFGTTANSDFTDLIFWFSSGGTFNTQAGSIGVQSNTVHIYGVQLEIGSVATALEKPDPRNDLANCQRFYQTGQVYWAGYATASMIVNASASWIVTPRVAPQMAIATQASGNLTSPSMVGNTNTATGTGTATATGLTTVNMVYTASADL